MSRKKPAPEPPARIDPLIREIRSEKVILDADLAAIYGVTTRRLNEQVKRNKERFPSDFAFQITTEEFQNLKAQFAISGLGEAELQRAGPKRSQIATASLQSEVIRSQIATASKRNIRYLPYAFTEHGAIMAANVLNSSRAVQMSVFVVRAFMRMRGLLTDTRELARKLAALEKDLKGRLNVHEAAIVTVLQRVMEIIDPPPLPPEPEKPKIGFRSQSGPNITKPALDKRAVRG